MASALTTIALFGLKQVLQFAGGRAKAELELIWKSKDDLEWMKRELAMIEAVLLDAERRCFQAEAVRLWLAELRDVCYDIQDMLEPYLLHCSQQNESRKRVWPFDVSSLRTDYDLAHEIKTIRKRLNDIGERKNRFNFMEHEVLDWEKINMDRETISTPEPVVLGRDEDKSNIVNMILQSQNNDQLFVIPIQGMGGLGKTTLAKLIFNDKTLRDSKHFDLWAWAYVSTNFDLLNIARRMIESFKGSNCNLQSREGICNELQNHVSGKRFLIVLDDVWNIDLNAQWWELKTMLAGSSKGSVIVVTTRIGETAEGIATCVPYPLKVLSDDICLQLFQQRAFKSTDEMDKFPGLVKIGKEIINKSGGVPLAANALGSMLSSTRDVQLWLHAKESQIRELHDDNVLYEKRTMSSLKVSYHLMPPYLKMCFAYCSIFPKGYKIDANKLVQHWIYLNFVRPTHETPLSLEAIAQVYLNNLISLSFLQKCEKNSNSQEVRVVLHDLMHDLAQLVAKDHDIKVITDRENIQSATTTSHRYLSLCGITNSSKFNEIVRQHGKARSIYLMDNVITISEESLSQLTCLRVVEVEGLLLRDTRLPKSIQQLKQLRYFSASFIKELPKITNLPNLQFLYLFLSAVSSEPIDNLQSLEYLKLWNCKIIGTLPIANFQNLLHLEIIDGDVPERLGDLKNLKYLHISNRDCVWSGCKQLVSLPDSICNLHNLTRLKLKDCSKLKELPNCLGNIHKLEYLDLSGCEELVALHESICNLHNLEYLDLSGCKQLVTLPESICNLESLLHLNLKGCSELEELPDCLGNLKSLQYLNLSHCSSLEAWFESNINLADLLMNLTSLKHLLMQSHGTHVELSLSPPISGSRRFPNFETLKMDLEFIIKEEDVEVVGEEGGKKRCCNIVALQHFTMLEGCLTIRGIERVKDANDAVKANLKEMHKVKRLELEWNEEENGDEDASAVDVFQSLQPSSSNFLWLIVRGYRGRQWPDWMMDTRYNYKLLRHLYLERIENVEMLPIGLLQHLSYLTLEKMANIRKIEGEVNVGNQIVVLSLKDMEKLEHVSLTMFPYLKCFHVENCPKIYSLPDYIKQHPTLQNVCIDNYSEAFFEEVASNFQSPSTISMDEDYRVKVKIRRT